MFVHGTEITKCEGKCSESAAYRLCLGNISKNFPVDNMKKYRLKGSDYDCSVAYDTIALSDILDILKCLMKKNNIVWNVCA